MTAQTTRFAGQDLSALSAIGAHFRLLVLACYVADKSKPQVDREDAAHALVELDAFIVSRPDIRAQIEAATGVPYA